MKKSNVILISPSMNSDDKKYETIVYPNTAIILLATILYKDGYAVTIIDGNRYNIQGCIEQVLKSINASTIFVGFSVATPQVAWSYKVTEGIKRISPDMCIVWGGVHPTLYPEQTITDAMINVVVINEACSTITALTRALEYNDDLSHIPGICFKSANSIIKTEKYIPDDMEKIPPINFSLFDAGYYMRYNVATLPHYNLEIGIKDLIMLPIIAGIGCAYRCNFCINVILNKRYRSRTAQELVDGIEYLQKTYRANFFQFYDEDFFIDKKRTFDFISLVEKKNLRFYFRCSARVSHYRDDYISVDVAKRLERIGMLISVMGAESGAQHILDAINKQITMEDSIRATEILSKTNIIPKLSFMVGLPGETKEDIFATYRLAFKLKAIDKKAILPVIKFALYPGTPLYNKAVKEFGFSLPASLLEWTKVRFIGYDGFYAFQEKPWVFNKKIFDRMNDLYKLSFHFMTKRGKIYDILSELLSYLIALRFKIRWFGFPLEYYSFKSYQRLRPYIKNLLRYA